MSQEGYLLNLGRKALDRTDQAVAAAWDTSLAAAWLRRLGTACRVSRAGQFLACNRVADSASYSLLQKLGGAVEQLFDRISGEGTRRQRSLFLGSVLALVVLAALALLILPGQQVFQALGVILLAAAVLYRVEWGLYAAAILLPFVPFKALFLLSLLVLVSWVFKRAGGSGCRLAFSPVWVPLVLFFVVQFYATVTSVSFWTSASEFLIPVTGLIFLFVMVGTIDSEEKLDDLVVCLALAGLITAVYAIYQYYAGPSVLDLGKEWFDVRQNPELRNRAYAVFENPNLLAQYLVLLGSFSLGGMFAAPRWWRKVFFGMTVVAATCCLVLTYSRGGWAAFAAALLVFGFFMNRQRLCTILPVAVAAGYFLVPARMITRITTAFSSKDSSILYRFDTWNSTLSLVRDYWVTGVGLGRRAFARVYATHMINANYVPHSHCLYLQLISELGILGLAVFIWLFISLFRLGFRLCRAESNFIRSLNAGLMGAFIGFLSHSALDYFLWYYKLGILIWLLVGVVLVLERRMAKCGSVPSGSLGS